MFRPIIYSLLLWVVLIQTVYGQILEPRRWSHLPVDINFISIGYVHTEGNIYFDPVLKIEDATVKKDTVFASYLRSFDLADMTARFDVLMPFQNSHWEGLLDGEPAEVERGGAGDPRIRLSVNFLGAPALKGKAFQDYRAANTTNTVAGAALAIRIPLGQYYNDKLLNLGSNRYVIRPQLGIVHTRGPWSFELSGSALIYTDNDDFLIGNRLEQDPLLTAQAHIVHTFRPGLWASISAGYDHGGQSTINGEEKDDKRADFLSALSVGLPISPTTGIKFAYILGRTREDIGSDTDNIFLAVTRMF